MYLDSQLWMRRNQKETKDCWLPDESLMHKALSEHSGSLCLSLTSSIHDFIHPLVLTFLMGPLCQDGVAKEAQKQPRMRDLPDHSHPFSFHLPILQSYFLSTPDYSAGPFTSAKELLAVSAETPCQSQSTGLGYL